jgi:hypothetical protein
MKEDIEILSESQSAQAAARIGELIGAVTAKVARNLTDLG